MNTCVLGAEEDDTYRHLDRCGFGNNELMDTLPHTRIHFTVTIVGAHRLGTCPLLRPVDRETANGAAAGIRSLGRILSRALHDGAAHFPGETRS